MSGVRKPLPLPLPLPLRLRLLLSTDSHSTSTPSPRCARLRRRPTLRVLTLVSQNCAQQSKNATQLVKNSIT